MNLILLAQTLAGSGLIALLVHILILAIVMGLIWWIITLIPLPPPFGQVVRVVFVVICVIILICLILPLAGIAI